MANKYTIAAVSPQVGEKETQYGVNRIYYIKLREEGEKVIELHQKLTTPAPQAGYSLMGTIDYSNHPNPKFKKEFSQGGSNAPQTAPKPAGGPRAYGAPKDTHTMYVAYAKDLLVAMIEAGQCENSYSQNLKTIRDGAKVLESEVDPEEIKAIFDDSESEEEEKPIDLDEADAQIPF